MNKEKEEKGIRLHFLHSERLGANLTTSDTLEPCRSIPLVYRDKIPQDFTR